MIHNFVLVGGSLLGIVVFDSIGLNQASEISKKKTIEKPISSKIDRFLNEKLST